MWTENPAIISRFFEGVMKKSFGKMMLSKENQTNAKVGLDFCPPMHAVLTGG